MNCLLCSRIDVAEGDRDYYKPDVDAYMKHLEVALVNPEELPRCRKYLSKYDADVLKRIGRASEARLRYTIFRTDSDLLLLSTGSFATPPIRRGRGRQEPIEEGYIGRGKTYYHFAYSYSQRLHLANLTTAKVMEKLVLGFRRYAVMLAQMRGETPDLLPRLMEGERTILERVVSVKQEERLFLEKQEQLLDAISAYQRSHSQRARLKVAQVAEEMTRIRPGFFYDLARLDADITGDPLGATGANPYDDPFGLDALGAA